MENLVDPSIGIIVYVGVGVFALWKRHGLLVDGSLVSFLMLAVWPRWLLIPRLTDDMVPWAGDEARNVHVSPRSQFYRQFRTSEHMA